MEESPGTWWTSSTSHKRPTYFSWTSPCRIAPRPTPQDSDSGSRTAMVKMHVFCFDQNRWPRVNVLVPKTRRKEGLRGTWTVHATDLHASLLTTLMECSTLCVLLTLYNWLINSSFSLSSFGFGWDIFPLTHNLAQNSLDISEQFQIQDPPASVSELPGL